MTTIAKVLTEIETVD